MNEHDDRVPQSSGINDASENLVGTGRVLDEFSCDICGMSAPYEVYDDKPPKRGVTK